MSDTTTDGPVGVVVDLSSLAAADEQALLLQQIEAALAAGDTETAQTLTEQLSAQLAEQPAEPGERIVTLDADAIAVLEAVQAGTLADMQAHKTAEVKAALAATDQWCARAFEEGVQLPADRKAYRQALRALFPQIAAATDSAGIDAIEIPAPPAPAA